MKFFLFILIVLFVQNDSIAQNADVNLLKKINIERNEKFDGTYSFITNSATPLAISVPVVMFSVGLIKKDSLVKQNSIMIVGAMLTSTIISTSMKYGINRDRPFVTHPDIVKLTAGGSPSFPSGHTSIAFSTATSVSLAYPKWYVIAPSMLWASAVGFSRMHLGVHYPSDVLVGALVGSGSAWLSHFLTKKIQLKKQNKAAKL